MQNGEYDTFAAKYRQSIGVGEALQVLTYALNAAQQNATLH
jgi:hypothetical protein